MNIVLLGASGHLGQCLQHTVPQGVNLIALNSRDIDLRRGLLVQLQLKQLFHQYSIHCVINAAAFTQVDAAQTAVQEAFAVNAEGVYHLSRACADAEVPLLHFSTDYVFDGKKGAPYEVGDIPRPLNVYGQSKLVGEQMVQRYCPLHWVLRVSWLYGAYGKNFGSQLIDRARQGQRIFMVQDQIGSPTDSMGLARIVWQVVARKIPFGLYHFCTGAPCTRLQYAWQLLQTAYERGELPRLPTVTPMRAIDFRAAAPRPRYSALKISKVLTALT